MIEISQQNVATLLTVAIQALVFGGLIACIVVGSQGGPSLETSPSGGMGHADYPPGIDTGRQPEARLLVSIPAGPAGQNLISFSV